MVMGKLYKITIALKSWASFSFKLDKEECERIIYLLGEGYKRWYQKSTKYVTISFWWEKFLMFPRNELSYVILDDKD